jgi:hypothetical protein
MDQQPPKVQNAANHLETWNQDRIRHLNWVILNTVVAALCICTVSAQTNMGSGIAVGYAEKEIFEEYPGIATYI